MAIKNDGAKMNRKPEVKGIHTVTRSRLFAIEQVGLEFSNGRQAHFERIVGFGAAVMVVPVLDDRIVMVKEYAAGTDRYELGFVKGKVDPGEMPEQAAQRELKEEIGRGANELIYVRELHTMPHYSNFRMDLFFAGALYPEPLHGDEIEPLEQCCYPCHQIEPLLNHPQINDPRVLLALVLVDRWLRR